MGDLGRKIRVGTVEKPLPMPIFVPVKQPETVEAEPELVPVRPVRKESDNLLDSFL